MSKKTILVDVREDLRNGREPFSKIMNAAASLGEGQRLLLLAPFEPVPLVSVLAQQGFRHTAKPNQSGDWEVLFVREGAPAVGERNSACATIHPDERAMPAGEIIEVDARGLEPPLPMVKILEALGALPDKAELRGRTDRRPIHLYAQLEERGFTAKTLEEADGTFITHIARA
jgi:uncharacterized protein (DUF2249 family)